MTGAENKIDTKLLLDTIQLDLTYSGFKVEEATHQRNAFKIKARKQEVMVHLFVAEEDGNLFGTINVRYIGAIMVTRKDIDYDLERIKYKRTMNLVLPPYNLTLEINVIPAEETEEEVIADIEIKAPVNKFRHRMDITRLTEILYQYVQIISDEEYDRIVATGGT